MNKGGVRDRGGIPVAVRRRLSAGRRGVDLVDDRPRVVGLCQGHGFAQEGWDGFEKQKGKRPPAIVGELRTLGKEREEKIRLLGFGPVLGIQAEESSKLRIGHGVEDTSRPAQGGGGNSQRSQSVAQIVLTVAESPLAVLPGLAEVDAGEAHQDCVRGKLRTDGGPGGGGQRAAALEGMVIGLVVVDRKLVMEALDRTTDEVSLGGVEVAAGGVDAEGPAGLVKLLPGGEAKAVLKQL